MSVKGRQIKIKPDTQPNCVIAMIRKVLSGIRMRKHDQTVAVKRQPRQQAAKLIRCRGQLARSHRMRPDGVDMHRPHRHAKINRCGLAHNPRPIRRCCGQSKCPNRRLIPRFQALGRSKRLASSKRPTKPMQLSCVSFSFPFYRSPDIPSLVASSNIAVM